MSRNPMRARYQVSGLWAIVLHTDWQRLLAPIPVWIGAMPPNANRRHVDT